MAPRTTPGSPRERGFTLAGVIVIMTVMMVFVAYTVPRQWSTVLQRERELQTIFIMKQYAKAINEFRRKNNAYPVSMEQLTKAKMPRFLRAKDGEYPDPLTGEVDWLIIPASAAGASGQVTPGTVSGGMPGGTTQTTPSTATTSTNGIGTVPTNTNPPATDTTTPQNGVPAIPAIPMKDYAGGPFIGVRPGKTGKSFLELNGAQSYEQWSYTAIDYTNAMNARIAAASKIWQ